MAREDYNISYSDLQHDPHFSLFSIAIVSFRQQSSSMLTFAGSAPRRTRGSFPSVCINRNGIIVEAHQSSSSSTTMYYHASEYH